MVAVETFAAAAALVWSSLSLIGLPNANPWYSLAPGGLLAVIAGLFFFAHAVRQGRNAGASRETTL